nr:cytochrome c oxidase assembly protein COX19 isoform X2 [Anser cygnoides]
MRSALHSGAGPARSRFSARSRSGAARTMSTAMNFGAKSFKPRPPDKGAFPLDHFGECSASKELFMECLRRSGFQSGACRELSMAYLQCRMESLLLKIHENFTWEKTTAA